MQSEVNGTDWFVNRHLGYDEATRKQMLYATGARVMKRLLDETIPEAIRMQGDLDKLPDAVTEHEFLREMKAIAGQNVVARSYIGQGYYGTVTPAAIRRNIFENPGWYTQYTPYQAEISQGRLEALLNFQTMVADLTGLPIANASLLDEATAAAEAMHLFFGLKNKTSDTALRFFVDDNCFDATKDVLKTRAGALGIELVFGDYNSVVIDAGFFGALVQYPAANGELNDYRDFVSKCHAVECYVCVATDLLALALLTPPGEFGADCAVGSSQRLGVPMGFGGPHAAFFATRDEFKRNIPGRIIGVSVDAAGAPALRMALQTREQHIRREKATSNICTAQALLAIMAGMYGVYHGPDGLRKIAERVHKLALVVADELRHAGFSVVNRHFFDTVTVHLPDPSFREKLVRFLNKAGINLFFRNDFVSISLDETVQVDDLTDMFKAVVRAQGQTTYLRSFRKFYNTRQIDPHPFFYRTSSYMQHPVFNTYHSETSLMRYIKSLENKDLSLTHSMIPLGSCTMKLNAAAELEPVSWDAFANIHPYAPEVQTAGYRKIINDLENYLCSITGFEACSLQPNSGAQGEYAGLLVIRAYQKDIGQGHRNVALIPASAHGTNPASAVMAGLKVVVVNTDSHGNIDMQDLRAKAAEHAAALSCLMVTYPSTHGVFESTIQEVCEIVHRHGGQVYMDGANLNAQVGLTSPALIGADVNHINLHKTFAIPHGGGGPGMGPICVAKHLAPYLPGHPLVKCGGEKAISAVSAAPWGSASILLISYAYIRMLGAEGVRSATEHAILNANYIKSRLEKYFTVLYTGKEHGRVAHELILDFRQYKHSVGIEVEDVAKRLMDYGFHAPTVSFPVAGTLMIEPTESESREELDRFCDALIHIHREIEKIASGEWPKDNNPLKNAPHTLAMAADDQWAFPYSRQEAVFPLPYVRVNKFWPSVRRVNNSQGDRNLICTCPAVESYR